MKLTTLCAGLIGLAGVAAIPAATDIQFKPEASTTLDKEFSVSLDFALDDMVMTMNGEEMDPAMMGMDLDEATAQVKMDLSFSDEYVAMKGGTPTELKRTFKSATAEYETGDGESGTENMSDIEGEVVVFKWNDETSAYDLTNGEGEEVEEEMEMMSIDADLRIFLPKEGVDVDAVWSVKGKDLLNVLIPGLNIEKAMARADQEAANEDAPITPSDFMKYLEELGEVECTYKGTKEVDGVALQVIELKPTMDKTIDLTDTITEIIDEVSGGQEMELSVELTLSGEGKGELLWDAAAGHFRSYKLDIELGTLVNASGSAEGMSGAVEVEATMNIAYEFTAE